MADILIAAAMLYHVCVVFSLESIVCNWLRFGCPQLVRRRRERDGLQGLGGDHILDYALPRIMRLTIETNVMTSKYTYPWSLNANSSHLRSASVGIIALLMIVIFPVGDSREFSVLIWSHVNIARRLVLMPVRPCFCPNVLHLTIYVQRVAIFGKL